MALGVLTFSRMTVEHLVTRNVATVDSAATVVAAAREMRNRHAGALVVTQSQGAATRPVGVITDRDLVVSVLAMDLSPGLLTAGDVMSAHPFTVRLDEDADAVIRRMRGLGIRRAPVVDAAGELRGLFGIDDYLEHLANGLREVSILIAQERREEEKSRLAIS
ncbi:MAG: CBS domain-containing protein [Bryobacteraceae bacterium]|nr:CBS domain-containing protein [Bryobacteraceae bacterium]